ncbi:GTP-binding protein [uncultured Clostridium sp.]|uniref:GTP-binding protein n=1 Tax=uncultured Clostridium sp. TaxID=59620 RepID=UPI0026716275|nr:GTP-binding protein [uncultured Clostridium sp.]
MRADLEIVCGFIEAGKTAFINALNELTKIKDEDTFIILTEDGHSKIEENSKEYKVIYFNDDISLITSKIKVDICQYKPYKIIIEYNGTYTMEEFYKTYAETLNKYCRLKCVYYIINGKTFLYYFKNLSELFIPYIENSNLILINNCKEITNKEIDEIYHIISSINYSGHILFSDDNSAILNELRKSNLFLNNKYRKIKMNFRKRFN